MGRPVIPESRVGLVYSHRRKLVVSRKAICLADSGQELTLHVSAKESEVVMPAESVGEPIDLVPSTMSPAGRLFLALQHRQALKADWVETTVRSSVGVEAARSVAARRLLANEALQAGWTGIFDWIDLTSEEKAWIHSHQAAALGDVEQLFAHLGSMPTGGYEARVDLLLPYLTEIAADAARWLPMLTTWSKSEIPGAALVEALLRGDRLAGVRAGIEVMTTAGWTEPAERWCAALEPLSNGEPTLPPVEGCPSWTAAALRVAGLGGASIDARVGDVALLAVPLLDDLVDVGGLSASSDLDLLPRETSIYIGARVKPFSLNEEELRYIDHSDELARRLFVARDRTGLQSLVSAPSLGHYVALLDVVDGKAPDPERLDPSVMELLDVVETFRRTALDGDPGPVPSAILDDPTVWPTLSALAQRGVIPSTAGERERDPRFTSWCDLQRVIGLLWGAEWSKAAELGQALASTLSEEVYQDEALNLSAFALRALGRSEDALQVLERALEGDYTEPLLVNTSILACEVEPVRAMKLLVRMVDEAPSGDLQLAAVKRVISVWEDLPDRGQIPDEISRALAIVLKSDVEFDDYYQLSRVAAFSAPKIILDLPEPRGDRRGPYLTARAQARFMHEGDFTTAHLVREFVAVYREYGHTPWFDREWDSLMQVARDSVFVTFGEAMSWAVFWDTLNADGADLMARLDRLIYLPQAGAHMAAYYAKSNKWLADESFKKFFFLPTEEILADRNAVEQEMFERITDNLGRTLSLAGYHYLVVTRGVLADEYNNWVARLRRDAEHRYQIQNELRSNLAASMEHIEHLDRVLDRLQRLPLSMEVDRERVQPLIENVADWRKETIRLRANL